MQQVEMVIVGAGPIGIELAAALKKGGISYFHFEAKQIGNTMSWWPPQTRFFSSNERIGIAGVPLSTPDQLKATREQYLTYLRQVVAMYDLEIRTFTKVQAIDKQPDGSFITTATSVRGEEQVASKYVTLVTGDTDYSCPLNIPGEDSPQVTAYLTDPHRYFRRRVLIVGGKNSAAESALRCYHAGAKVILSYRRDKLPEKAIKYWLVPEINGLIKSGEIEAHFSTVPVEITPTHVTLESTTGDRQRTQIECDDVLKQIGYVQDSALLRQAGVQLVGPHDAPPFDEQTMETTVENLFIAGTCCAGTQNTYSVFIENCHVHVERIYAAITGGEKPPSPIEYEHAES